MKIEHYLVDVSVEPRQGAIKYGTDTVMTLLSDRQITSLILAGHHVFNFFEKLGCEPEMMEERPIKDRLEHPLFR